MSQTQKSPAPVAAGCEAQYQKTHDDYATATRDCIIASNRTLDLLEVRGSRVAGGARNGCSAHYLRRSEAAIARRAAKRKGVKR